jgi:methionyl-tRNA formyltransferase
MKKVYISDNKEIGRRCKAWASEFMPQGFKLTDKESQCDIFISVGYNKILSPEFISPRKCFNFHHALLPEYAGVCGCTWPILNGDKEHFITLHEINGGIDSGDIIDISHVVLCNTDTAYSLYHKVTDDILRLFRYWFADLLLGDYLTRKQDKSRRRLWTRKDMADTLDLTTYMRATYFPGKPKPFYINMRGEKIELDYV